MKRFLLIPVRINERLTYQNNRLYKIILMTLVLVTALYTKEYNGPYQAVINDNVGGIFYVMFGSLLFSMLAPNIKARWAVLTALTLTCILEYVQYLEIPFMQEMARNKIFAYLFGSQFNPRDFIYYAIGALLGMALLLMLKTNKPAEE